MPPAPTLVRATTVFLVCAGGLAACGVAASTPPVAPQAPSITAVVRARYAESVDLDHGGLLIAPPPARAPVTVSEADAEAMFGATAAVAGPHQYAILGLGVVTLANRVENPPPTTTTTTTPPPPPTTAPSTTLPPPTTAPPPPPTTTTTRPPTTTTTTTPTTTTTTSAPATTAAAVTPSGIRARFLATPPSTTAPPTTAPSTTAPGTGSTSPTTTTTLPTYRRRLAWVGIVWGAPDDCSGSTTTVPAADGTTYVAVVIDARSGHRVLAYRSGGSAPCTGAAETPSVTEPDELLSVPWQPVGPSSTAVQISIPPCGSYYGWTQIPTTGGGSADQVVVSVPFDPTCGTTVPQSYAVDQVVPLGAGQALVGHAPVGPVQALQAPPDG